MRDKQTNKSLYLKKVFSKEDPILKKIRQKALAENVERMQISAYEGGILQFLCQALKVKKAIEIGTLFGYSSLMIARALPKNGRLFSLDIDAKRQQVAKALVAKDPAGKKISFIPGLALDSLKKLEPKAPFDMVFIDADKAAYLDYLNWSYKNLKPRGLLVADNTFLFGAVYGESKRNLESLKAKPKMQAFNRELAMSGHYISTLIPTEEGLTVAIKKAT